MATAKKILCSVCDVRFIENSALEWCFECDKALCSKCIDYHSRAKATQNHELIGVEQYKKLPVDFEIKQHCDTHKEKYQNYCRRHAAPCCKLCISTIHKECHECGDVTSLERVIRDSKSSFALDDLERRMHVLKEYFKAAVKKKEDNIGEINMKSTAITEEIKNIIKMIQNYSPESLEKKALLELSDAKGKAEKQIMVILKELKMKAERLDKLLEYAIVSKEYASNLQAFLCTKEMEKEVTEEERRVELLQKDSRMDDINLSFVTDTKIHELKSEAKSIGKILTSTKSSKVRLPMLKETQAQMVAPSKDLSNVNIVLEFKINIPRGKNPGIQGFLSGCVVLSDQRFLFSYHEYENSRVSLIDKNGTLYWELLYKELGCHPYDVTCVDEKTVAMTCNKPQTIIINIESGSIEKPIKTKHRCYGITCFDNKLLYSYGTGVLQTQCLKTGQVIPLPIESRTGEEMFAVQKNKLYVIDRAQDLVTCYNLQGTLIWKWKNTDIINVVRGLAVDWQGNVYVTGASTRNIVVISSDGNEYKSLRSEDTCITMPGVIFYDKHNKSLLVCENDGVSAGLFSVQNNVLI